MWFLGGVPNLSSLHKILIYVYIYIYIFFFFFVCTYFEIIGGRDPGSSNLNLTVGQL